MVIRKMIHMQKFLCFKAMRAGLAIAAVLFSAGCVSRPLSSGVQPFGVIGADSDIYVFAPVTGNEQLLKALFAAFVPEKTANRYLSRTSIIYAGIRYNTEPSMIVVSLGSYPAGAAGLLFSKKDGWEKRRSSDGGTITYYRSAAADVAFGSSGAAYALFGGSGRNTVAFLRRITEPQQPSFPPRFDALQAHNGAGEAHAEIGVYIRSAQRITAELAGLEGIELPVRSIEFYLRKDAGTTYRYSAVFETVNARTAGALRLWIGSMLSGTLSIDGSSLVVKDAGITEERLIDLFRSFHLNANAKDR